MAAAVPPAPCPSCERLPEPERGPGRLYLWSPLGHSASRLVERIREGGFDWWREAQAEAVVVRLDRDQPAALAEWMWPVFSRVELDHIRALFVPGEAPEPGWADYPRVRSLRTWLGQMRSGWLLTMLAEERVASHFQPIVEVAEPRRVYAHEALFRGWDRDGGPIGAGPIFSVAAEADLQFQVDLAARLTAVRDFARQQPAAGTRLFINFTPTAIYDPAYCLQSTFRAVDEAGLAPDQVVFEVVESEQVGDVQSLVGILDYYRGNGFRVALDDLGAGYASLTLLNRLQPDYVKLDRDLVQGVDTDPRKAALAGKLLEAARELGITSLAEGVETEGELRWLQQQGAAGLAQGFLFGRPAPELVRGPMAPVPPGP